MAKTGVRILGGRLRGRRLAVPGRGVRPTESRVREALFNLWGPAVMEARVLDAFAGSGAIGFEALSRGAAAVVLVDDASAVVRQLQLHRTQLLAALAAEADGPAADGAGPRAADAERVRVVRRRLPAAPPAAYRPCDLLFADPPYRFADHAALLAALDGWAAPDARLILEHAAEHAPPPERGAAWRCVDRRRYGGSVLSDYRRVDA
ncbi:MAG: 16S rRNA (guanine(966)-N(2))-methyltransferase RsmD [Acidobacteriota bacterium]